MNYVLIIGSSNMDLNIYLDRFPEKGETVTGGKFEQFLGGKGANQAVASVRSGAETKFIGRIGNDIFGDQMIKQLSKEGIDTTRIVRDQIESSGIAFILIDKYGENMISVAPGANVKLSSDDIIKNEELIRNAKVIVVQMEISINIIEEIYRIASQGNCIKILNPAPLKMIPKPLFKNIDIIIPNEGELNRLNFLLNCKEVEFSGTEKLIQLSKNIANFGVKFVITTLGSKGCYVYDSEKTESILIPAYKVQAVDTVGAGDCFNGVLASKLSKEINIIKAVKYAMAAASIAVTRKGAQKSMPYQDEIQVRYEEFNKILMI
ncbi:MAG: ribokinase [Promethearchaeota archaeon]